MTSYPYPTDFDCNKLAQEEMCKHYTERPRTDGGVEPGQHDQTESVTVLDGRARGNNHSL